MINHLRSVLFLTGLLIQFSTLAQDTGLEGTALEDTGPENTGLEAAVVIGLQTDREIWAGQQVTLNLDLKTTGFSFSNSHFNLPEVSGAFLMQTDTTTIKLTEKINAKTWQVIRYPLALYPQKAGQLVVPSINARFKTSAGFGSPEKDFELQTDALELTVKSPPGLEEGDLVVTTTSFELDHSWQPVPGIAHTGDALTLTVIRRATDISAMLLPPLPVFRIDGLAAYPQSPVVSDKTDRGDLTGERTDSIIWVVEKPGTYEIPGIRFQWWDPLKLELKQQIVPGQRLEILSSAADDLVTGTATKPEKGSRNPPPWLLVPLGGLAGLLAVALWLRFGRRTGDQHLINERSAFASLQKACKSNNAGQTYSAIYAWLAFCSLRPATNPRMVTLSEFALASNDKKLTMELELLQNALVSANSNWRGADLLSSLQAIRHTFSKQKKVQSEIFLAPLNP